MNAPPMPRLTRALVPILACLTPFAASAEIIDFTIPLTGAEEVPPIETTGTGDVSIQIDTVTREILIGGSFDLLMGSATTAALVGFAPPGAVGNVDLITLLIIPANDEGTSGDVAGSGTLTPDQLQALLSQQTYINIRSTAFPDGELRGQVVPAPSLPLVATTATALAIARRRR